MVAIVINQANALMHGERLLRDVWQRGGPRRTGTAVTGVDAGGADLGAS